MLTLSPRPRPDWVARTEVSRDDLRMHWAGRQAFEPEAARRAPQQPRDTIQAMRSTPRRQRAEALVLTMARYRCAGCGAPAHAVRERRGAPIGSCSIRDLEPVCPRCVVAAGVDPDRGPDPGPMAGAVADVMARVRPVASTA